MDFFNGIIEKLLKAAEWYFSTPLPYDTAEVFYRIIDYSTNQLVPLLQEYITIILGANV